MPAISQLLIELLVWLGLLLTLVKTGVLDYARLRRLRPAAVVVSLISGAILTTPEVNTQVLLAVPFYLIFEVALRLTQNWERQK